MKKLILVSLFSLFALSVSVQAEELPSMCFDGTYAGGGECEKIIDGEKVDVGILAHDFFVSEDDLALELENLYTSFQDELKQ